MTWVLAVAFGGGSLGFLTVTLVTVAVLMAALSQARNDPLGLFSAVNVCAPSNPSGGSGAVQAGAKKGRNEIPSDFVAAYKAVSESQNIPFEVLAGIGKIETSHGTTTLPGLLPGTENYAGAGGPMQFLKSSWKIYGADGDKDGDKDRYSVPDAVLGAARHLRGSIGKADPSIPLSQDDIIRAIHRYNPGNYTPQTNPYVRQVMEWVHKYANGNYSVGPPSKLGKSQCVAGAGLPSGPFGKQIAYAAAKWTVKEAGTPTPPKRMGMKVPYSWGGGDLNGPSEGFNQGAGIVGFDCSALARYAVYQASKGKIKLPRTTQAQWTGNIGDKVSVGALSSGDLVFYGKPLPTHMGIYYGEVNGVRWMVEAPFTGSYVRFAKFRSGGNYLGAIRVRPPAGMGGSPGSVRALAPAAVGASGGSA